LLPLAGIRYELAVTVEQAQMHSWAYPSGQENVLICGLIHVPFIHN